MKTTALYALLALTAAGCGGAARPDPGPWQGDPTMHGVLVEVRDPRWPSPDGLHDALLATLDDSLARWHIDGSWLHGWRIVFQKGEVECGGRADVDSCTDLEAHTITVDTTLKFCVEGTALPHEIGHVALHLDADHEDEAWGDDAAWAALWGELKALPGSCLVGNYLPWRIWSDGGHL